MTVQSTYNNDICVFGVNISSYEINFSFTLQGGGSV